MSSMENSISEGTNLSGIKGDIFDKIHDENVRVYRNIQDFMKDRDERDTRFTDIENSVKKMGSRFNFVVFLSIANLAVMTIVLLTVLGII